MVLTTAVQAAMGEHPFDLLICGVRIVNVFNDSITDGSIGILDGRIVYAGPMEFPCEARETVDGGGRYVLPGFVDAHMHLESSMLTPAHFAETVMACGTTTVAADPHETANVMGRAGVETLLAATKALPLRVLMMAPSTVPSAPGFEGSGYAVDAEETERLLALPGIAGLGEVMDFNGVAAGEKHILSVVEAARRRGFLLDGHASILTGRRLQAFRAAGIDSDHTTASAEKLREELALGFTVQIQSCMLSEEMVKAMNEAPVQDRICLVTDDVPLPRLMREGHLNAVVEKAVALGLSPLRAVRYATINPAVRLRLYDVGGIAPGMAADLQLVGDLSHPRPSLVISGGRKVFEDGRFLAELPPFPSAKTMRRSIRLHPVKPEDFLLPCAVEPSFQSGTALVNMIGQDGRTVRTRLVRRELPLGRDSGGGAVVETAPYLKMAVFNRYGQPRHGLALIDGMEGVSGAAALTYGHDSHNLTVFGGNDGDMALAANTVRSAEGGLCAVSGGCVRAMVPLPLAGLLSEEPPHRLLAELENFLDQCRDMGFCHEDLMSFFTIMPLAVSPEIKCTDRGLLDVTHKRFLPLIERVKENA